MYKVIIELTNGVIFSTEVLKGDWDKFQEWLKTDTQVHNYMVA